MVRYYSYNYKFYGAKKLPIKTLPKKIKNRYFFVKKGRNLSNFAYKLIPKQSENKVLKNNVR
mgnify:CR=1 FL=1